MFPDNKKYSWHKIADSLEEIPFGENHLVQTDVSGKMVCLSRKSDQLFACVAKCPHAGGRLADGYIDATNNIVCPLHRYKFNLQNGRNTSGEGYFLKTFPVETTPDGVFIGIEETGLFSWLK